MALQAIGLKRAVERRVGIDDVTGGHIPNEAVGVPGERGLEEGVADFNDVIFRLPAGADGPFDFVGFDDAFGFHPVRHLALLPENAHAAARKIMKPLALGLHFGSWFGDAAGLAGALVIGDDRLVAIDAPRVRPQGGGGEQEERAEHHWY